LGRAGQAKRGGTEDEMPQYLKLWEAGHLMNWGAETDLPGRKLQAAKVGSIPSDYGHMSRSTERLRGRFSTSIKSE